MARRAEKAAATFRRLKLKLGGGDGLDVERVRAVRGVTDLPLMVDVNEWWSLDEALDALPQLAEIGVEYCEQPLEAGDEGGRDAEGALADPDLRRRGLSHARGRRGLRRDRARHQHQAREVGRDPRGDPHGARGACAAHGRDARLHARVRARRSPPAAASRRSATTSTSTGTCCCARTRGPGSSSSTVSRCRRSSPVWGPRRVRREIAAASPTIGRLGFELDSNDI